MKVKLENREYDINANGKFMLKYQETFNENMIIALYKCTQEKDILTCAKLTYCAIDEDMPFEEWLASFETPLFILTEMDSIIDYLVRSVEPTVSTTASEGGQSQSKKKKNN